MRHRKTTDVLLLLLVATCFWATMVLCHQEKQEIQAQHEWEMVGMQADWVFAKTAAQTCYEVLMEESSK